MDYTNIKYYFYCRHKLGKCASEIGKEIMNLFQTKIPIKEGLKNWSECIKNNENNSFLFNYDEKNKSCFENLQFQLINQEPVETQMIQFYALCRYQLNPNIPNIILELSELYGHNAPSTSNLHSWVKNNWKNNEITKKVPIPEIDLTRDEFEENDEQFEPESETVNEPDSEPNPLLKYKQDSNIKYYFCCRNELKEKIIKIQAELKELFKNDLLPKCIGTLYYWSKQNTTKDKIDKLFNYETGNKSGFERLKFALNCSDSNLVKKMQFYSLCRYQLSEKPSLSQILVELKELYANNAPSLSLLNTWITELWENESRSEAIEQDTMEVSNDFPIEINSKVSQKKSTLEVSQYLARLQKHEQALITERDSFVFDLQIKDTQIDQLREDINILKSQNQTFKFNLDNINKRSKEFESNLQKEKELNLEIKSNESLMKLKLTEALEKIKIKEIEYHTLKNSKDSQLQVITQQFADSQKDLIQNIEQVLMHLKMNNQIGIQTIEEKKLKCQIQQLELFKSKIKEINILSKEQNSIQINNSKNELQLNALKIVTLQTETNRLKASESNLKTQLNELKTQNNLLTNKLNVAETTLRYFEMNMKDCKCKKSELEAKITKTVSEYQELKKKSLKEIMEYMNDINHLEKTIHVYKLQLEEKESTIINKEYLNYKREKEEEIKNLRELFDEEKKNLCNSYKNKIHIIHSNCLADIDKLKLENTNLREINSQNEETIEMQQNELEQLRRHKNNPLINDKNNQLLELKLAESNFQIQIWEKNYINLKRDLETLSNENQNLKVDLENALELNGLLNTSLDVLENNQPSNDHYLKINHHLKSQVNDLKQNISALKIQLEQSYEFLFENNSNFDKLNQDINSFSQSLSLIFGYSSLNNQEMNGLNLVNDNVLLSQCLQKIKETFEEKKKFKIISLENGSSLREKKILQVKLFKPSTQYDQTNQWK